MRHPVHSDPGSSRLRVRPDGEPASGGPERRPSDPETRRVILCGAALAVCYALAVLLTVNLFHGDLSPAWMAKTVLRRVEDLVDLLTGNRLQSGIHFWLCRFAAPAVAGMALGASGACFQALFRNPMASPAMLGVEAGGTLGSAVYLTFFYSPMLSGLLHGSYESYAFEYRAMSLLPKYGQYLFVFGGCVAVTLAVLLLVKLAGRGTIRTVPLMTGGALFSGSASTVLNVLLYCESVTGGNSAAAAELQAMQAGAFRYISDPVTLACFSVLALLPLAAALPLAGRLNLLAFGEDEARLLGACSGGERLLFLLLSTLMTAAVVAFCGTVSFVGIAVPHIARAAVGCDFRRLLPASAFLGGIFLLLAVTASYLLGGLVEPGLLVTIAGGLVFLVCLTKYRRAGHDRFFG